MSEEETVEIRVKARISHPKVRHLVADALERVEDSPHQAYADLLTATVILGLAIEQSDQEMAQHVLTLHPQLARIIQDRPHLCGPFSEVIQ